MKILTSGVIAALICLFKYPHRLFHGFLWAEDGAVFIKQAIENGASALIIPYAGYQHLVPRLIVGAWSAVASPERFSHGFAWTCIVMYSLIGAALFALSRRYFPHGIRGDLCALGVALLPFLVPQSAEIYFTVTNLQWFFAPVLAFLVLDLSSGRDSLAKRCASFVLALTGPFGVMLLPVALTTGLLSKVRRVSPLLPYLIGCAIQVMTYLHSSGHPPRASLAEYPLPSTFLTSAIGGPFTPAGMRFTALQLEIFAVVIGLALILVVANSGSSRKAGVALLAGAVALWLIGLVRQGAAGEVIHWDGYGARYLLLPELCMGYTLVWSCVSSKATRVRFIALLLLGCLVATVPPAVSPDADAATVVTEKGTTILRIAPGWDVTIN